MDYKLMAYKLLYEAETTGSTYCVIESRKCLHQATRETEDAEKLKELATKSARFAHKSGNSCGISREILGIIKKYKALTGKKDLDDILTQILFMEIVREISTGSKKAKEIAKCIDVEKIQVNQILYSQRYGKNFTCNENYEWSLAVAHKPLEKNGVLLLTDISDIHNITVYKDIDFADRLESKPAALLSMKQTDYVLGEVQIHKDTEELFIEIHKWQSLQKEWNGFILKPAYYNKEEKIRQMNFTDHLAEYSTLRLLGYYVGGNIGENERHRILMNCVYYGLASLDNVIAHIDCLKNTGHTASSVECWKKDLEFMNNYYENKYLPMYRYLGLRKFKWANEIDNLERTFLNEYGLA